MKLTPSYVSLGEIFGKNIVFFIPPYQRGFAWDVDQVAAYIDDVEVSYRRRSASEGSEHFLGGILSIKNTIPGVANGARYELVDGQQRITTSVLFAKCMTKCLHEIRQLSEAVEKDKLLATHLSSELQEAFDWHYQTVNKDVVKVEVLTLSRKDEDFFRMLMSLSPGNSSVDSHIRLRSAYRQLWDYLAGMVSSANSISDKLGVIRDLSSVLRVDMSILHMVVEERVDAYRLFQVINDRGMSLSDGDLLRVRTLEKLEGHSKHQARVEKIWDDVLSDSPSKTHEYLGWIYESYTGRRSKTGALADSVIKHFFGDTSKRKLSVAEADLVVETMERLGEDVDLCRKLSKGIWLYDNKRPVTPWDRSRLKVLLINLGHTLSMPLLLAASHLSHTKFRDIVLMLERAFFRYKIICNAHVSPLKSLYAEHSVKIRSDVSGYKISSLRGDINVLLEDKAPINNFKVGIAALHYQRKDISNRDIKYLFTSLDAYCAWFDGGAVGIPARLEGNSILDFDDTSIEHIYPKSAAPANKDLEMESIKNSIPNLTILDPGINSSLGNLPYTSKRPTFQASSIKLNNIIGKSKVWDHKAAMAYQKRILAMAEKVFVA